MQLVIVESPAKAKTIEKYLGKDYKVLASYGHIRDLPQHHSFPLASVCCNIAKGLLDQSAQILAVFFPRVAVFKFHFSIGYGEKSTGLGGRFEVTQCFL